MERHRSAKSVTASAGDGAFTFENFIPAKEWVIEDLDWKAIKKYEMFDESKHTSASNLFL